MFSIKFKEEMHKDICILSFEFERELAHHNLEIFFFSDNIQSKRHFKICDTEA